MLVPYEDNGAMNQTKRNHNYHLSACRSSVERAFRHCKCRFRRLHRFESHSVVYAVDHIVACFMLSNFIILEGRRARAVSSQLYPIYINIELCKTIYAHIFSCFQNNFDEVGPDIDLEDIFDEAQVVGEQKRNNIAAQLFHARQRRLARDR